MDRLGAMDAFVRVIETGSFSGAARQMGVGQPAVSKTIAQLEDRLGVRLLLRTTHGLTATEAGQNFYERAKRTIEEADEADLAARGASAALAGRLRIGTSVSFGSLHVLPRLPGFLARHPNLEVVVVMDDRNIDLMEEGIDIALRMGKLSDSTMTVRRIGECRRLVLGTPAYLEAAGEPKSPAELMEHQAVIHDQPGLGPAWTFRQGSNEVSVTLRGRVRVTAGEGVRAAVMAGLGLTVGSEWLFSKELQEGALKAVLPEWTLPGLDLWAAFPSGRRASVKARAFADFIEAELRPLLQRRDASPPATAASSL